MFVRYNTTTHIYEKDTSAGSDGTGPWVVLPLNASILNEGILNIDAGITTSGVAGEIILGNNKNLRGRNAAASDTLPLIKLDANNLVQVGNGTALVKIGNFTPPSGTAINDGSIVVDGANVRLVFYAGGNRYWVTGTLF